MAKFTRTAYATNSGDSNQQIVREIANSSGMDDLNVSFTELYPRPAIGRRKVRITIIVETISAKWERP